MTWHIKKVIGAAYADAMRWLFIALVAYCVVSAHFLAIPYIGYADWYGQTGACLMWFAVQSLLFLVAGYKFRKIGVVEAVTVTVEAQPVDVVVYMASLATNPAAIDPIMDRVRVLTAGLPEDKSLTPNDERVLSTVYRDLEDYLINHEPLRKFTQGDLRRDIAQRFPHAKDSPFWSVLKGSF